MATRSISPAGEGLVAVSDAQGALTQSIAFFGEQALQEGKVAFEVLHGHAALGVGGRVGEAPFPGGDELALPGPVAEEFVDDLDDGLVLEEVVVLVVTEEGEPGFDDQAVAGKAAVGAFPGNLRDVAVERATNDARGGMPKTYGIMAFSNSFRNTMPLRFRLALILLPLSLGACAQAPATQDEAMKARVDALVERTLKHMVFLEGGSFEMGDWCGPRRVCDTERDSKPLHKVTLDSFSMMPYQATYEDFDVFTDAVGEARINSEERYADQRGPRKAASPNWYGAKAFCQWLGQQTHLPFDLPTEAQWEYAARSRGQRVLFATDTGKIERGRNFPAKKPWSEKSLFETDLPPDIGSYPPNPAGLYGMSEGKTEWVNDWYAPDYYKHSPEKNPQGPETGTEKVMRGSSGVPAEAANLVMMRTKETPRTTKMRPPPIMEEPILGYSSLPSKAVRCVINAPTPIKQLD
ncbi:MAG: hypothetical protein H6R13_2198 [Proteobacteria bacterium]|nr:hypothetical protein [Pseudomonadota bacterium]